MTNEQLNKLLPNKNNYYWYFVIIPALVFIGLGLRSDAKFTICFVLGLIMIYGIIEILYKWFDS